MDISTGHRTVGMTKECCNCDLTEAKIIGNASKAVPKDMGRDRLKCSPGEDLLPLVRKAASYPEDDSVAPAKGLPMERMHLRRLEGYIPGAQPGETAIKLNTNENPFPPSPTVMAALAEITARALQHYPDPLSRRFREAAAQLHGVTPNQIIATNGGDELLRLTLTTFVDPGRPTGIITPS